MVRDAAPEPIYDEPFHNSTRSSDVSAGTDCFADSTSGPGVVERPPTSENISGHSRGRARRCGLLPAAAAGTRLGGCGKADPARNLRVQVDLAPFRMPWG